MDDWIKTLSVFTILHSENELINQAEDVIYKNMMKFSNHEDTGGLILPPKSPTISS